MKLFVVMALTLPMYTSAASLIPAELSGQVQQFTDSGKVSGCGITFAGIEKVKIGRVLVFNGSIVIFRNGGALVKGRTSDVESKAVLSTSFSARDLRPLKTLSVWAKAPASSATVPIEAAKESQDKGYIIYGAKFDPAFSVIRAVLEGEPIQIGFSVSGRASEQVMFGIVGVSLEEHEQLKRCIVELAE